MLIKEFYKTREDGVKLYHTYSDENKFIRKKGTNDFLEDAVDVEDAPYEYDETNEKILSMEEQMRYMEEIAKNQGIELY